MASKRKGSLAGFAASDALSAATAAKGAKPGASKAPNPRGNLGAQSGRDTTTAITVAVEDLDLLRAVAANRKILGASKRNSVSEVISGLIQAHRAKLETEAGPFLKLYKGKN